MCIRDSFVTPTLTLNLNTSAYRPHGLQVLEACGGTVDTDKLRSANFAPRTSLSELRSANFAPRFLLRELRSANLARTSLREFCSVQFRTSLRELRSASFAPRTSLHELRSANFAPRASLRELRYANFAPRASASMFTRLEHAVNRLVHSHAPSTCAQCSSVGGDGPRDRARQGWADMVPGIGCPRPGKSNG